MISLVCGVWCGACVCICACCMCVCVCVFHAASASSSAFNLITFTTSTNLMLAIRGDGYGLWKAIGQGTAGVDIAFIRATMNGYLQWKVANGDIIKCVRTVCVCDCVCCVCLCAPGDSVFLDIEPSLRPPLDLRMRGVALRKRVCIFMFSSSPFLIPQAAVVHRIGRCGCSLWCHRWHDQSGGTGARAWRAFSHCHGRQACVRNHAQWDNHTRRPHRD